jgi:hypothetical protein
MIDEKTSESREKVSEKAKEMARKTGDELKAAMGFMDASE